MGDVELNQDQDMTRLRAYIEALEDETQLPPEPRLAEEVGMSRGRLRTLLKRLEAEGTIWRHVGKGCLLYTSPSPRDS